MRGPITRCRCPKCHHRFQQMVKPDEPTICPSCFHLFGPVSPLRVPVWFWSLLAVLIFNAALLAGW